MKEATSENLSRRNISPKLLLQNSGIAAWTLACSLKSQKSGRTKAVVASIACDPNVWNWVPGNPTLQAYLQSQKIDFNLQHLYPGLEESLADASQADKTSMSLETASQTGESDDPESQQEDFITNALKTTKDAVVNNLSGFFLNLFGSNPARKLGSALVLCLFE